MSEDKRRTLRIPFLQYFDSHMQEVIRGAGLAFALRIVGAGFGFLFNVLIARMLGAEGAGVYYLALTMAAVASIAGNLGLDQALLRFTATNVARDDWDRVAGAYRRGVMISAFASSAVALTMLICSSWIAEVVFSDPALAGPLRLMALGIPCMSLLALHAELLKGLRRIRDAVLVQGLGVQLISLPVLLLLGGPFGIYGAVLAFVSANLLIFLLSVILWRRATPHIRGVRGSFGTRLLMGTSVPLMWVVGMNLVMTWTDTVMIGIYMESKWVGIYGASLRLVLLTDFILMAVNSIVAPKFATLYARGEHRALNRLATNASKLTTLLALPPTLLILIVPEFFLGIFGEQFRAGASSLAILTVGQFVSVAIGSVGYLLIMTGREKAERNIAISFAALNVVLNFLLIPVLGIEGAAISTSVSLAVRNLVAYAVWRRGRISR